MNNAKLPRYFNLVEYVSSALRDLVMFGSCPELNTFCELNSIVNFAVETTDIVSNEEEMWSDSFFRLGVKFDSSVGDVMPLDARNLKWLEDWVGAVLTVEKIDQYQQGGGYVYYRMHEPDVNRREKMDPMFPYGPIWKGGQWK